MVFLTCEVKSLSDWEALVLYGNVFHRVGPT